MQQFDFVHSYLDGVLVATPVGEIDRVAAAELRHELMIHLTQPGEPVVVRLDRVSSLDFGGVCALVGANREASMRHLGFCLAMPGPAVAEMLSGTNVARDIPTFATLREAVERLEEAVGVPLLERDNRSVRLTPAGREFLHYAEQTLAGWQALERRL
jgi:anti-anti-sigma factor